MTTKYHFYNAGAIPGIAGIFAGVVVEVNEAHTEILSISPLHPPDALPSPQPVEASPDTNPSVIPPEDTEDKEPS